ncbi:hypothetical protein [Pseudomonas sp.]|nr:hypothetical protein [Pseudomonas sp.]
MNEFFSGAHGAPYSADTRRVRHAHRTLVWITFKVALRDALDPKLKNAA